jgi:hypothetical protein
MVAFPDAAILARPARQIQSQGAKSLQFHPIID